MRPAFGRVRHALGPLPRMSATFGGGFTPGTKAVDFFLREIFDADKGIPGRAGANQLVELGLQRSAVTILRILDQEHHQEGDDGSCRVDDQLPRVGVVILRTQDRPDDHAQQR